MTHCLHLMPTCRLLRLVHEHGLLVKCINSCHVQQRVLILRVLHSAKTLSTCPVKITGLWILANNSSSAAARPGQTPNLRVKTKDVSASLALWTDGSEERPLQEADVTKITVKKSYPARWNLHHWFQHYWLASCTETKKKAKVCVKFTVSPPSVNQGRHETDSDGDCRRAILYNRKHLNKFIPVVRFM